MSEDFSAQSTTDNYLPALTALAQNVIEATHQIAALYEHHHLAMNPETIIRLYYWWLGFILGS